MMEEMAPETGLFFHERNPIELQPLASVCGIFYAGSLFKGTTP